MKKHASGGGGGGGEIASWRAIFRYPRLRKDQLAVTVSAPIPVEVYRKSKYKWDAREPGSGTSYGLNGVDSAAAAKAHIEGLYREQVEPWSAFDAAGKPIEETVHASY